MSKRISETDFVASVQAGETTFRDIHLAQADLTMLECYDVVLKDCVFEEVDLARAVVVGLQAEDCVFLGCKFTNTDLREACFTRTAFYAPEAPAPSDFRGSNLKSARFVECDARLCDFEGAALVSARFKQVDAQGANFGLARFENIVEMVDCIFRDANLTGAALQKCDLSGTDFQFASFNEANLSGANLTKANLNQARFMNAVMRDADLRGANITSLDVRSVDLQGAMILEGQQRMLLEAIGITIMPNP